MQHLLIRDLKNVWLIAAQISLLNRLKQQVLSIKYQISSVQSCLKLQMFCANLVFFKTKEHSKKTMIGN